MEDKETEVAMLEGDQRKGTEVYGTSQFIIILLSVSLFFFTWFKHYLFCVFCLFFFGCFHFFFIYFIGVTLANKIIQVTSAQFHNASSVQNILPTAGSAGSAGSYKSMDQQRWQCLRATFSQRSCLKFPLESSSLVVDIFDFFHYPASSYLSTRTSASDRPVSDYFSNSPPPSGRPSIPLICIRSNFHTK